MSPPKFDAMLAIHTARKIGTDSGETGALCGGAGCTASDEDSGFIKWKPSCGAVGDIYQNGNICFCKWSGLEQAIGPLLAHDAPCGRHISADGCFALDQMKYGRFGLFVHGDFCMKIARDGYAWRLIANR
ncbi:MAG TPA: hypothetical protein VFG34_10515 [Sphingopyxis sp.]|nr:hypothetical protein [Sphingopyxis sp.]